MNIWSILTVGIVLTVIAPNFVILLQFFTEPADQWDHVRQYLLPDLLKNTGLLLFFTGLTTIFIGTSLAWLVTAYDFPGTRFFKWGLILPLAIPPYIGGYTYHGMLNYTGVIQTTLRDTFELDLDQKYFDILNLPGAVFIFTLFLYPYIYTMTQTYLETQSASLIENARLLGKNGTKIYFSVVLPISRAVIIGGTSLVLLEVLNDYGVVQYFGVPTFTTAIFQTWFGMNDLASAIKLSATVMFIIAVLLIGERILRGRKQYSYTTSRVHPLQKKKLTGRKKWSAFFYCLAIFSIGFVIPGLQLVSWMMLTYEKVVTAEFWTLLTNSLIAAISGAAMIMIGALVIANFTRLNKSLPAKALSKMTILGYSIPGAVIAVGISTVFIYIDNVLAALYEQFDMDGTLFLSTSLLILIIAYAIRFLAIGFNAIDAEFDKAGTSFHEASRLLGKGSISTFFKVDLPMVKGAVISGFILSFIEILKELPLTLILRPFNFDTLSTKAYQYASDEQIQEAALPSLLIITLSALAIYFFYYVLKKERS
ncbi:ABC transporter permease [Salimicrobium halophilum]|uniref:ABC transporter permease n=1 Tax=Salimicrobium halophilum TaxID=86666 RepID=UPI000B879D95|nr:iron ABC transporter permease [Salimicrobium halophilum]